MIHYINEIEADLQGKRVLLRVDFNIPINKPIDGRSVINDDFRIRAVKKTIDYLLGAGARVVLVSHISDIDSFQDITSAIGSIIGRELSLCKAITDIPSALMASNLSLLENIRSFDGEEENSVELAKSLSQYFDIFVNDAFAVSHREHASVSAVAHLLPAYAGLLMRDELNNLQKAIDAPVEGKVLIMGGAKIATKLPVIKNFLDKAETILIGGALANTFLKARGYRVGLSKVDDDVTSAVELKDPKIILPEDVVVSADATGKQAVRICDRDAVTADEMILDIGFQTRQRFSDIIARSTMIIWNGPMGLFEIEAFAEGTLAIADAVAKSSYSIIGGGDTASALQSMLDQFSYVSTGGGAMLEFLAGNRMPGLKALGYYEL